MCTTPQENIYIHLARRNQQRVGIGGWYDRVAVGESDPQAAMVHDLRERKVGRVDIVVALDHLQVWGYIAEEVIGLAVGQVSQA